MSTEGHSKASIPRYVAGAGMILFGLYMIYKAEYWESSLYFSAGIGFLSLALMGSPRFAKLKPVLNVVSWVFIIMAVLIFLFLLRTDQFV